MFSSYSAIPYMRECHYFSTDGDLQVGDEGCNFAQGLGNHLVLEVEDCFYAEQYTKLEAHITSEAKSEESTTPKIIKVSSCNRHFTRANTKKVCCTSASGITAAC